MQALSEIAQFLPETPIGFPIPISGGSIHRTWRWGRFFLKTNAPDQLSNFQAEADGLSVITATRTIRCPQGIAVGRTQDSAWLALEFLDLRSSGSEELLAEQLAALHAHTSRHYGYYRDNFIGSTPQSNTRSISWPDFFRNQRIEPLFRALSNRGLRFNDADRLCDRLPVLLPPPPPASLIHGDLWSGNRAWLSDGTPVIFDPAVHYADSECDIAMTRLFGGFGTRFYQAYREIIPAPDDFRTRETLYQLYHILNHTLLFGSSYQSLAASMIRSLI